MESLISLGCSWCSYGVSLVNLLRDQLTYMPQLGDLGKGLIHDFGPQFGLAVDFHVVMFHEGLISLRLTLSALRLRSINLRLRCHDLLTRRAFAVNSHIV